MNVFTNQFHRLRAQRLAESTTEFLARGKSVIRCDICQMANFACMCAWRPEIKSKCEFILLMHRIEVFKPTNTGRLVADILPQDTHVFCWDRTEPSPDLLTLINDQTRQCFIVFPADAQQTSRDIFTEIPATGKISTFILLDGTWKQSGRMFHLSRWLDNIPCVSLPDGLARGYTVRKSHQDDYLSTAEAAALCLGMANEKQNSEVLFSYFQLFNEHYLATRACCPPVIGELHRQLVNTTLVR